MSEKEIADFVGKLKDSGCDVIHVCHRHKNPADMKLTEGNMPENIRILRKRILGGLNGIVVIEGNGTPVLKTPAYDTAFIYDSELP